MTIAFDHESERIAAIPEAEREDHSLDFEIFAVTLSPHRYTLGFWAATSAQLTYRLSITGVNTRALGREELRRSAIASFIGELEKPLAPEVVAQLAHTESVEVTSVLPLGYTLNLATAASLITTCIGACIMLLPPRARSPAKEKS